LCTNQVVSRQKKKFSFQQNNQNIFQYQNENNQNNSESVLPALGELWSHSVNTRIILEYGDTFTDRILTIVKSPNSRVCSINYIVDKSGIVVNEDSFVEVEGNFWNENIKSRASTIDSSKSDGQHAITINKFFCKYI
jgi:hypothetical protein